MPSDSLTIALDGDVSLERFADAISHFQGLVAALAEDAGASNVRWLVTGLEAGSALATVQAVPKSDDSWPRIEQVVRSYIEVGHALERGEVLTFSRMVQQEAHALASIVNGEVDAIRFETAEDDAVLTHGLGVSQEPKAARQVRAASYGAVQGRVQTLSSRGGLRFTLYDTLNDKAVSCYLTEGQQSIMRDAWGKVAVVEGWLTRDPISGRPLSLRRVSNVTVVPESDPEGYRRARGVLRGREHRRPEEAVRRLRDG